MQNWLYFSALVQQGRESSACPEGLGQAAEE